MSFGCCLFDTFDKRFSAINRRSFFRNLRFCAMVGFLFWFLWIVWLINAYNFMDGIDGIAGIQALSAGICWTILRFYLWNANNAAFLGLIVSCIGFCFFDLQLATCKVIYGRCRKRISWVIILRFYQLLFLGKRRKMRKIRAYLHLPE